MSTLRFVGVLTLVAGGASCASGEVPGTAALAPEQGSLDVTPEGGLSVSGVCGGPFASSSIVLTLHNTETVAVTWSSAVTQPWLSLSSTSGSLASQASVTVTASIEASALAAGNYSDTITITNVTSGRGTTTRTVSLTVHPAPVAGSKIADHSVVHALWTGRIPESAIVAANQSLKIGYGHTSHGNQVRLGMNGLVAFANAGHLGGTAYSQNLFAFSQDCSSGLCFFNGSGYDPGWLPGSAGTDINTSGFVQRTREFLDSAVGAGFNVIMWSWCNELAAVTQEGLLAKYLQAMEQLEQDYPNVTFVYMTGHLEKHQGTEAENVEHEANVNARNAEIRQYCIDHDKWLYDFADIESYDPDGNYYGDKHASDACNYDADGDGKTVLANYTTDPPPPLPPDRNWALDWQAVHTQDVEWYDCGANDVHTHQVNANMKAYAAWWLWARLGGWDGSLASP